MLICVSSAAGPFVLLTSSLPVAAAHCQRGGSQHSLHRCYCRPRVTTDSSSDAVAQSDHGLAGLAGFGHRASHRRHAGSAALLSSPVPAYSHGIIPLDHLAAHRACMAIGGALTIIHVFNLFAVVHSACLIHTNPIAESLLFKLRYVRFTQSSVLALMIDQSWPG